jgi:glutamate dehydrogenase
VLQNSYRQARILSRESAIAPARIYAYGDLMETLEAEGILDRDGDALPTVSALGQRRRAGTGLHRPELAVLLAHAKQSLTDALLESDLVEDPWLARDLRGYFPPAVVERFGGLIAEHRLRRELTATLVANELVDALGPTFVSRLSTELGASASEVVRAYRIARDVTGAIGRFATIDALDDRLDDEVAVELLEGVERLVETVTRWYLTHAPAGSLQELVEAGHEGFDAIEDALEAAPPERVATVCERLEALGVPQTLAQAHALTDDLSFAPDVLAVAAESDRPLEEVGLAFARLGDRLRFGWLEAELDELPATQRMQRWAIQALRDDARRARRDLVAAALAEAPDLVAEEAVAAFVERHASRAEHLASVMRSLSVDGSELAGLMVVVRELRSLTA